MWRGHASNTPKTQFFQDHHILPKRNSSKILNFKTYKSIYSWVMRSEGTKEQLSKTTTSTQKGRTRRDGSKAKKNSLPITSQQKKIPLDCSHLGQPMVSGPRFSVSKSIKRWPFNIGRALCCKKLASKTMCKQVTYEMVHSKTIQFRFKSIYKAMCQDLARQIFPWEGDLWSL